MIALFLIPFYMFGVWFINREIIRWLKACHIICGQKKIKLPVIILIVMTALLMPVGFLLPACRTKYFFLHLGNLFLGFILYAIMITVLMLIIRTVLRCGVKVKHEKLYSRKGIIMRGSCMIALWLTVCIGGIINASWVRQTDYDITVNKNNGNAGDLNVVLVADLHLGFNIGNTIMEEMVERINACDADIVLIAGDIFDNDYDAIHKPERIIDTLKKIKSKYGVYACYGNHDVVEPILAGFSFNYEEKKESDPRMEEFLEAAGVILLRDEAVLIDDSFYIYGRPDKSKPGRDIDDRKQGDEITAGLDKSKPIIVVDHQPYEQRELAAAGVDVLLNGHTHNGQSFPLNIVVNLAMENAYGYKEFDGLQNIVTSGVGLFGPKMRVFTKSEVCNIKIHFTE